MISSKVEVLARALEYILSVMSKQQKVSSLLDELLLQALLAKQGIDPEEVHHMDSVYWGPKYPKRYNKFVQVLGSTSLYTHVVLKDGSRLALNPPIPSSAASAKDDSTTIDVSSKVRYINEYVKEGLDGGNQSALDDSPI